MKSLALAALFALVSASSVLACDHPGIPDAKAYALSPTEIEVLITNDAREGSNTDIWFFIDGDNGNLDSFNAGHILFHHGVYRYFSNLIENHQYCYHVWARDNGPDGCESEQASARVCATTAPPFGDPDVQHGQGGGVSGSVGAGGSPVTHTGNGTTSGTSSPSGPPGTVGAKCVPDTQPGTHCQKTGTNPSVCNYEICKACIPHQQSCGPNNVCCSAAAGDICVISSTTGQSVCDIPDYDIPGNPKRPGEPVRR